MMLLLGQIEQHLRASGTPHTTFGREALGDPHLVSDLRRGREPGPRTAARIAAYLAAKQQERA